MTDNASAKAIAASLTDSSGIGAIVFTRGYSDEPAFMPILVTTAHGRLLVVVTVPPRWAGAKTLTAFSARATAAVSGICPLCDTPASGHLGPDGLPHQTFEHAADCLAADDVLRALLATDQARRQVGRNAPCPCGGPHKAKNCPAINGSADTEGG